ncbi:conserved hypothetical protein [Burkholderia pseudomallei Pakistan 9]|nr:conserved hypothetical protein [Burkholderia pseudomallei Pakistan 9]
MRTTYNGSYGASLLLNIQEGTYFVALFQQKAFWRVIRTASEARAGGGLPRFREAIGRRLRSTSCRPRSSNRRRR